MDFISSTDNTGVQPFITVRGKSGSRREPTFSKEKEGKKGTDPSRYSGQQLFMHFTNQLLANSLQRRVYIKNSCKVQSQLMRTDIFLFLQNIERTYFFDEGICWSGSQVRLLDRGRIILRTLPVITSIPLSSGSLATAGRFIHIK